MGKYHIHKAKFGNYNPCLKLFIIEIQTYLSCLKNVSNSKSAKTIDIIQTFNISFD